MLVNVWLAEENRGYCKDRRAILGWNECLAGRKNAGGQSAVESEEKEKRKNLIHVLFVSAFHLILHRKQTPTLAFRASKGI